MRPAKALLAAALAAAGLAAVGTTALASVATPARTTTATTPTINLTKTAIGKILTTGGFTLYMFTHDSRNHDTCMAIHGCSGVWPSLFSAGKPKAGPGVKSSLLGTITVTGGKHQVTYAGHPLYTYKFDTKGSTSYVGASEFGGKWYALNAAGKAVK